MHRITSLLFLLVFTLVLLPVVHAQDENEFLGLSEDDYDLLQAAVENTDDADSFQITYTVNLSISDTATGDQTLDVEGTGTITHDDNAPTLLITSSGTSTNLGELPASFDREVRFVDGVGYNNLINLATGSGVGWQGQVVDNPFRGAYNLARILVDPSALTSLDILDLVNLADGLNALDLQPYITVTRGEDTADEGQTFIHFTATLDTESLFESPEFAQVLLNILAAAGQDPGIPDDQMAAAGILIGSMFRGSSLTVELYVDQDDYLSRATANMVLALDASVLTGEGSPTSMDMTLDFSLSGFDEDYPVEAPGNVVMLEPDSIPTPAPIGDEQTIASGSPVIVDLSGTVELFYNAANPETVTITARSLDGSVDTTLDIYDPDGNLLESNDDTAIALPNLGVTDSAIPNLSLPAEGLYTIRLGSFSGEGNGQIEVLVSSGIAQTISSNLEGKVMFATEPIKIYLTGQDAVDLVYEVGSGETLSFYVTNLDVNTTQVDSTLEILDADGEQVAFNDDFTEGTTDSGIENLVLDAGVYTIRVNSYDETEIGGVLLELVTGTNGERDTGETVEGTALTIGDSATGTITDASTGEYTFEGEAGQVVTIVAEAIDPDGSEQDLHLTLYDADGDELTADDDSGESLGLGLFDAAIISFTLPDSGAYQIVVDSIFDITGEYEIRLDEG